MNPLAVVVLKAEAVGMSLRIEGEQGVVVRFPNSHRAELAPLVATLRQHKEEAENFLQSRTPDSAYANRVQAALAQINRPDYPAGMIPWLGEAHPELYTELRSRIPDEIHLAWTARAPLEEFDGILARLVETHRQACSLYREHLAAGQRKQSAVSIETVRSCDLFEKWLCAIAGGLATGSAPGVERRLAAVETVDEAKAIRDQAEAIHQASGPPQGSPERQ